VENAYGPLSRVRVVAAITDLITAVRRPHPIRVAIDGVDAAGKTTLADELATVIERRGRPVIRASIDGFHNPRAIRYRRGPISPEGYFLDSFNYPALREALLQPLGPGGSRAFRRAVFDVRCDEPVAAPVELAPDGAVLLLDGVFLLREDLREHFDFSVFVHADFAETLRRAEQRDLALFGTVEEVRRRYEERYVPGQRLYLHSAQPERHASVVVDNNDPAAPRIAPSSAGLFIIVSGLPGSDKTPRGGAR
jgi:uridine kinase